MVLTMTILLWLAIWFCRYKFVHDNITMYTTIVVAGFVRLVDDHRAFAGKVFTPSVNGNGIDLAYRRQDGCHLLLDLLR